MPEADITGKILVHESEGLHLMYSSNINYCKGYNYSSPINFITVKPLSLYNTDTPFDEFFKLKLLQYAGI